MTARNRRKAAEAVKPILEAGRAINVGELAEEMLSAFGGAKNFASSYHLEFEQAKAGSISRSKMLDGVLRLVATASAQNKSKEGEPSQLSDDELALEVVKMLQKRGVQVNGDPEETPPF